jgi:hypothetical protein
MLGRRGLARDAQRLGDLGETAPIDEEAEHVRQACALGRVPGASMTPGLDGVRKRDMLAPSTLE